MARRSSRRIAARAPARAPARVVALSSALGLALALSIAPIPARPQSPPDAPALDDAARGELLRIVETRGFTRGLPTKPVPSPLGDRVYFLRSGPTDRNQKLYVFDVATGVARLFVDPAALGASRALSREEQARRERQRQTERGITSYEVSAAGDVILVPYSGDLYVVDAASARSRRLTETPEPEIDPDLSPDGSRVAFARGGALVVIDVATGLETVLVRSDDPNIEYGIAEFVAQEEMDRSTGHWWSPDSRRVALTEVDSRGVPTFRVPDFNDPVGEGSVSPYPKAGDPNAVVRLGVVDAGGGEIAWLDLGDDVEYLARVHWAPDGASLWVETQPRSQKRLDLRHVDLAADTTGAATVVLREEAPDWVNLHDDFRFLGAGETFLWSSERTGHRHLEVVRADGKRERTLTSGEWDVTSVVDVDEGRGEVLFAATTDGLLERHLYRVPLAGGDVERITVEPGWHGAAFHDAEHDLFVESFEDERTAARQRVRRRDGTLAGELPSSAFVPPVEETGPLPEFFTMTADRDLRLDLRVVRPRAGESRARLPLVLYVYTGPGSQQVLRRWPGERGLVDAWLARRGFVVARVDARGVSARGHASEAIFAGRLGDAELADQVAGVHALIERFPEIDPERVGIWGWSYGGYMTLMALLRAPDVFRAGVSIAPVVDWRGYDTHYTERYLGLPSENAAGYDSSSVLTYVTGLEGSLTLVHGVGDDNVHFRESMTLVNALVEVGKQFDLMVYPGTHMMESVAERMHIYELVWRAFATDLGGVHSE